MTRILKLLTVVAGLALVAMPAQAYEKGDWIVRGGIGMVSPDDPAYFEAGVGGDPDISIIVDDGTSLVLSATYMFSPNWGLDILGAWPFSHDIKLESEGVSAKFAETKQLPPTFSLQYHFMPDSTFMPYAGLGLNYTYFYDESVSPDAADLLTNLSIDSTFGFAAQLGADIALDDNWLINIDIRYIKIEPDVKVDNVETLGIEINPLVYGLSVGYKF